MQGPESDRRFDPQHDPFSSSHAPGHQAGNVDFSQYEDPLPDIGSSDDEIMRRMNRKTSPVGRIVGILIVGGALGLGYWAYQSNVSYENRNVLLEQAGTLQGEAMLDALRNAYAQSEHDDVKERILLNLGKFKDAKAVPLMIQALDEAGIVRRSAARSLAHIGSPMADGAKPKLLEVLPKTDATDKPQVVWALAVLKEPSAVPDILSEFSSGHLQNLEDLDGNPSFDPKVIVDVVGPQKIASDELLKNSNKSIRALVAAALAESAAPSTVEPLIKLLQDDDTEVVKQAAAGLGRTGDPRAGEPLFALLKQKPSMRQGVLDSLARSTSAPDIAKLLPSVESVDLKRSLVSLLRDSHDPRVVDTFAALVSDADEDIRQTAALALADNGDPRAVAPLLLAIKAEDRTMALDALDALGLVAKPQVADALIPLLKDSPGRTASIIKAIGKSGNAKAGAAIAKYVDGDDRESAQFALADLKYAPIYPKLLAELKRPKDVDFSKPSVPTEEIVRNREIAIRALGRFGKPDAIPGLMVLIEDNADSAKLRQVAGSVLGQLADQKALATIIEKAKNSALDEATRSYYVQGLWQADAQAMSGQLAELLQPSQPAEVRRAAALAMGYAADPANDQLLLDMLKNPALKREAAFAIVLGGNEAAATELYKQIETDRELREVLQDFLMADDSDYFNLITAQLFTNGEVFRRLTVADALRRGKGELTFSYPWSQTIARLKSGWSGAGGLSARDVRAKLYEALRGQEPKKRRLAAEAFSAMKERGLLIRSRDEAGPGQQEARETLLRDNRGSVDSKS
ncbi:MAG: repeat protein [Myxococcaceae bacterium]|nr:repeat protein [Myxococcaceae bacterium]